MSAQAIEQVSRVIQEAAPLVNQAFHASLPLIRQVSEIASSSVGFIQATAEMALKYPLGTAAIGTVSALVDTVVNEVQTQNSYDAALRTHQINQERHDQLMRTRGLGTFLGEWAAKAAQESITIYAGAGALDLAYINPLNLPGIENVIIGLGGGLIALGGICPDCLQPHVETILQRLITLRATSTH